MVCPHLHILIRNFWLTEAQTVFSDSWVFVGYNHEFKDTGDAIPIKVAQQPILLVKNIKGNINAFHNVCSHRCVILVDQAKNVKKNNKLPLSCLGI